MKLSDASQPDNQHQGENKPPDPIIQGQYKLVLDVVSHIMINLGYQNCTHCRLSYESAHEHSALPSVFQGLTRADRGQQPVMIKWAIESCYEIDNDSMLTNNRVINSLQLEMEVMQQLKTSQAGLTDIKKTTIVPLIAHLSEHAELLSTFNTINDTDAHSLKTGFIKSDTQGIYWQYKGRRWRLVGFTMPFVEMGSVKEYLKGGNLTDYQKWSLLVALATSLNDLHQAGWIHGDVKPSNFLVVNSGKGSEVMSNLDSKLSRDANEKAARYQNEVITWLADLSYVAPIFSKTNRGLKDNRKDSAESEGHVNKSVRGTPAYLAPECWQGNPVSVQSDVYAFGIMMYEILVGHKPYHIDPSIKSEGLSRLSKAWAESHCQAPIPLLPKRWCQVQRIMDKLLAKQSRERYQNMQSVITALYELDNDKLC